MPRGWHLAGKTKKTRQGFNITLELLMCQTYMQYQLLCIRMAPPQNTPDKQLVGRVGETLDTRNNIEHRFGIAQDIYMLIMCNYMCNA